MNTTPRRIFREEAFTHYAAGRSRTVLPRFATPGGVRILWALLGLLTFAMVAAASIRIDVPVGSRTLGPGTSAQAEVTTEERPIGSLFPVVGRLFER